MSNVHQIEEMLDKYTAEGGSLEDVKSYIMQEGGYSYDDVEVLWDQNGKLVKAIAISFAIPLIHSFLYMYYKKKGDQKTSEKQTSSRQQTQQQSALQESKSDAKTGKPDIGKPDTGKSDLLSTDTTNYEPAKKTLGGDIAAVYGGIVPKFIEENMKYVNALLVIIVIILIIYIVITVNRKLL